MKNLTKILISCGIGLATLPMAAAGCFDVPTECDTDEDCVAPETCNISGQCEGGEGEGEGEGEGDVSCDGGDIDDGACLEDRNQSALPDPYVCDGSICVDPNELFAGCGGGDGARYDGGPIIYAVEAGPTGSGDPCTTYNSFVAEVYSETAFDDGLNANNLHYINADGAVSGTYSEAALLPSATELDGFPGYYLVDFYLCGDGGDGAVHLNNNNGDGGNSFCMDQAN
ncbi:MAG: hypothetical protein A2138_08470 [Deltaproteobacteria bacterium RBG_16_71_12]|nr:MAG: hypothetical protein A2138_08470 [Deltaproteobacteria bacterium RBG_16_71_12]